MLGRVRERDRREEKRADETRGVRRQRELVDELGLLEFAGRSEGV